MSRVYLVICCTSLLATLTAVAIENGEYVRDAFKNRGVESMALIETGLGVRPQYGQGVVVSCLHVLTSAILCTRRNRVPPRSFPPRLSIYVGATRSFSSEAHLYTASSWEQLHIFGRRRQERSSLCLITLDFPIDFSELVYPASFGISALGEDADFDSNKTLRVFSLGSAEVDEDDASEEAFTCVLLPDEEACSEAFEDELTDGGLVMDGLVCVKSNETCSLNVADTGAGLFGDQDHLLYAISLSHILGVADYERPAVVHAINKREKDVIFKIMRQSFKKWTWV